MCPTLEAFDSAEVSDDEGAPRPPPVPAELSPADAGGQSDEAAAQAARTYKADLFWVKAAVVMIATYSLMTFLIFMGVQSSVRGTTEEIYDAYQSGGVRAMTHYMMEHQIPLKPDPNEGS